MPAFLHHNETVRIGKLLHLEYNIGKNLYRVSIRIKFYNILVKIIPISISLDAFFHLSKLTTLSPSPRTGSYSQHLAANNLRPETPFNTGTDFPPHDAKRHPMQFCRGCHRFSDVRLWFLQG